MLYWIYKIVKILLTLDKILTNDVGADCATWASDERGAAGQKRDAGKPPPIRLHLRSDPLRKGFAPHVADEARLRRRPAYDVRHSRAGYEEAWTNHCILRTERTKYQKKIHLIELLATIPDGRVFFCVCL